MSNETEQRGAEGDEPVAIPDGVREAIKDALSCWVVDATIDYLNGHAEHNHVTECNAKAELVHEWLDSLKGGQDE